MTMVGAGVIVAVGVGELVGVSVLVGTAVAEAVTVSVRVGLGWMIGVSCQSWLIVWQEIPIMIKGISRRVFLIREIGLDFDRLVNLCSPISV